MMLRIGNHYYTCDECPIISGIDRRLHNALQGGYEPQFEYCGCDKVEFEFYIGGFCEDALCQVPHPRKNGIRKTGRAYRREMSTKKQADLLRIVNRCYMPHAGYVDWDFVDGVWTPVGNHIKHKKNSNRQRFRKRCSNRAIRRGVEFGSGKGGYKKCRFD